MHPEEVQSEKQIGTMTEKPLTFKEVDIARPTFETHSIEGHDENGGPINGNGTSKHEDPIIEIEDHSEVSLEEGEILTDMNAVNGESNVSVKSSLSRVRGTHRTGRASPASEPPVKSNSGHALQMEVSMEEGELEDNMEPLIIQGSAEDLEVSACVSDEMAQKKTSSVIVVPPNWELHTQKEKDNDIVLNIGQVSESKPNKKSLKPTKSLKQSMKVTKAPKPAKTSENKVKVSRSKSPKPGNKSLKLSKASLRLSAHGLPEVQYSDSECGEYNDEDELPLSHLPQKQTKDVDSAVTPEEETVSVSKSPSRRGRPQISKFDYVKDIETVEPEKSDLESAPRRSSRPRQTPQKYNSFLDSCMNISLGEESPDLNKSDQGYATAVRSVTGRKSFKKSRNMSALNASLHNDSSPWEEYKILTPSSSMLSPHSSVLSNKRKASMGEDYENDEKEAKKICVEGDDLEGSFSKQRPSFFSIVTSPITMLRGKLRGSSVSCSTPVHKDEVIKENLTENTVKISGNEGNVPVNDVQNEENVTVNVVENEENVASKVLSSEEESADTVPTVLIQSSVEPEKVPEDVPQGRSWCTVM